MLPPPHVVLAAGGALGSAHAGMAIARSLAARVPGVRLTFIGDGRPVERHAVRAAGFAYTAIPCRPRPRGIAEGVRYVAESALGYCAARWLLKEQRASMVIGLSGPVSGPVVRAAHAGGLPIVLVEPDAWPSATTRRFAADAEAVCLAFEEARPHLPISAPTRLTGAPARPATRRRGSEHEATEKRIVVMGGVGGARSLNRAMPRAIAALGPALSGWRVVHQAGEGQLVETEARYRAAGADAVVVAYIDELGDLLRSTDLVVCRAGGATLAEIAQAGTAALLVPDSRSDRGSERENAGILEQQGACRVLDETTGDLAGNLSSAIGALVADDAMRRRQAEALAAFARPNAADHIAAACCPTLGVAPPAARTLAAAA